MKIRALPLIAFALALALLVFGKVAVDWTVPYIIRFLYPGGGGEDINPGDWLFSFSSTPVMRMVISLPVLAAGLFVILAKRYQPKDKNWAYGAVGTLLGYWLKG
jgi:hypothetical protein